MTIMPWRGPGPNPERPWESYPGYDPSATQYPIMNIPDTGHELDQYGQMTEPVPVPGDPGPSRPNAPTAPTTQKKKRGLLGSIGHILGNVFMPEPDSLWAAALRGGIYDAKANQRAYKNQEAMDEISMREANVKLNNLIRGGEYKVAGNNLVHYKPDGSAEIIAAPRTPGEKETLVQMWQQAEEGSPYKQLLERILLQGNSDEALRSRENVAGTRAGATVRAAGIRAAHSGGAGKGGSNYEYKIINGVLMRRPK